VNSLSSAVTSLLVFIGFLALDYGTLQQMASIIASSKQVDRGNVIKAIRSDSYYKGRAIPGIICAALIMAMPWIPGLL
jgi:hypothetical protein